MKRSYIKILIVAMACVISGRADALAYNRQERDCRNYIHNGTKLYHDKRYGEAEVQFQKAIESDPKSLLAQYNLAATLIKLGKIEDLQDPKSPMSQARERLEKLAQEIPASDADKHIIESSCYNLGNIAFNLKSYAQSIEFYKKALRLNPDNDKARENLRLAQLRLREQQNNQNDQNKNQNQDQDKNKDQNKDKDQQKEQNKDEEEQKKDKQDQQQQNNQDKKQDKPQQPNQPQGGISDENAAKILQAMENEESKTRRRIMMQQGGQQNGQGTAGQRAIAKPW